MKNKMVRDALDSVNPTPEQRARMWAAIAAQVPEERNAPSVYQARQKAPRRGAWIPAAAALFVVAVLGGMVLKSMPGVNTPTPAASTSSPEQRDAMPAAYKSVIEKYIAAIEEGWDGERLGQEDMSILTRDVGSTDALGYHLQDLDSDGSEELLITDGNVIYDMYTMDGDTLSHVISGWERNAYFLAKDNIIANIGANSASSTDYYFYRLDSGTLAAVEHIAFNATVGMSPWLRENQKGGEIQTTELSFTTITEEEAKQIIDSYAHIEISNIPLSSFSEESRKTEAENQIHGLRDELQELEDDFQELREKTLEKERMAAFALAVCKDLEEYSMAAPLQFAFYDLFPNGSDELLLGTAGSIWRCYTIDQGKVQSHAIADNQGTAYLCQDNIVEVGTDENGYIRYEYIRLNGDNAEVGHVQTIFYDPQLDSWYKDPMEEGNEIDVPIEEAEMMEIRESFGRMELDWKPISEFPVTIVTTTADLVQPLSSSLYDGTFLEDGAEAVFAAGFTEEDIYADDAGVMGMMIRLYDFERFDSDAIHAMAEGDVLVLSGENMKVESLEWNDDGILRVNGGYEEGGASLHSYKGIAYEIQENDQPVYFMGKSGWYPVSGDFVFEDASQLPSQTSEEHDWSAFVEQLETDTIGFTPYNTKITLRDGEIVGIYRFYTP